MNRRNALKTILAGLLVPFVGFPEIKQSDDMDILPHGDTHAWRGVGFEGCTANVYGTGTFITGADGTVYYTDDFYTDALGGPTWEIAYKCPTP